MHHAACDKEVTLKAPVHDRQATALPTAMARSPQLRPTKPNHPISLCSMPCNVSPCLTLKDLAHQRGHNLLRHDPQLAVPQRVLQHVHDPIVPWLGRRDGPRCAHSPWAGLLPSTSTLRGGRDLQQGDQSTESVFSHDVPALLAADVLDVTAASTSTHRDWLLVGRQAGGSG